MRMQGRMPQRGFMQTGVAHTALPERGTTPWIVDAHNCTAGRHASVVYIFI
jgi:hypothetical protein